MAAEVTLNVSINDAAARSGINAIANAIKPLTTPIKIDVDTSRALRSLRDLNTIASNLEKQLNRGREGLGNGHDAWLANQRKATREFSAQLKQQMQAEQELYKGRNDYLHSSAAEYDAQLKAQEEASRRFSNALKAQMQAEQEAGSAAEQSGSAAASGADGWSVLGGAISTALGHLASRALMAGINKVRQGVRDALTEMKNVDTELTNISKVSGKTGEELAAIGDRAYETASRYGESASTYLEAVYSMQKAGMGDMSENMGELAIKTMLVGDTTQDVATKFLLSANAAWKLEGNMDRLTQIVDEADYINNNYATSLDKLAAGMPIVASIAAQTGMTAEETMAAIGTITAATQESGTKAATALRALILNISGEVGKYLTEEGEEFEVTEESVKSMQGLLEKYAKTEMDAARAAGEMIDPMTAIQAIFKGMAEDDLSDVELFNLLSGMGGKLRTNQLTALVQNFETLYKDMMDGMKGAAGTADKEIDLMMDSWERKTQVLKNTWTEFIADIVSSDTIKGGIDLLTDFVSGLDNVVNRLKNPFYDSETTNGEIETTEEKIKSLKKTIDELSAGGGSDLELQSLKNQLEILQKIADLKNKQYKKEREEEARKLQDKLTQQYYDSMGRPMQGPVTSADTEALFNLQQSLGSIQFDGDTSALQASLSNIVSTYGQYYENLLKVRDAGIELTDAQKEFISTYESTRSAAESSALFTRDAVDGWLEVVDAQGNVLGHVKDIATAQAEADEARAEAQEQHKQDIEDAQEAQQAYLESQGQTAQETFQAYTDAITDHYQQLYSGVSQATTGADDLANAESEVADGADAAAGAANGINFGGATASAQTLLGVIQAISAAAAGISIGVGGFGFATGTTNAPGGPTLVNELGPELISENGRAYIANGGRPGIVNLSRGAIVLPAHVTEQALHSKSTGKTIHAAGGGFLPVTTPSSGSNTAQRGRHGVPIGSGTVTVTSGGHIDLRTYNSALNGVESVIKMVKETGSGGGGGGAGGGGKSAKKIAEELADETKDILSNLEKQAKLADNRKQYEKEAQLYQKAQAQIDKQVAAYKKAGYKETDDEILDLLNKRFDYDKKIDTANKKTIKEAADELKDKLSNLDKQAKLADTEGDYLKEVQFYESAQEAIKEMVERYRKAGYKDDSTEIVELLQKNYDYADKQVSVYKDRWNELIDALETDTEQQELANKLAEKEQALLDAQEALSNAMGQRTIRTYNASTGQWEWVADQSKIKSAQESLTKAEESYAEEVKDQAIQELEQLRDTMADLNDVILGPALSAIMMKAESSDEFQNFARALNAVYGVGSYLSSTEGSSNVISTANDSHDTIYSFGNVTLTEEQASTMSVAQLAQKLQVLKIS